MRKEFVINDFDSEEFLHSRVNNIYFDVQKKIFAIDMHAADLSNGEYITTCTLTVTDWSGLEVYEYSRQEIIRKFDLNKIPEINQIIDLIYNEDELILTDFGFYKNAAIDYKFTKPKIKITGEYEPD